MNEKDDTATRLIEALNQDGFILYQQPIHPIVATGGAESFQEILVRFREEEEKLLPPGTFIPVLESSGLMHLLDRWVVNRVVRWIHARRRVEPLWTGPCSSINLSNDSLTRPDFAPFVKDQLQKGRVSGRKFAFEIAEDDAHEHLSAVSALAAALKPDRCRIVLTSYTGSLIPLAQLPSLGVDAIKLDIDTVTTLHASTESEQRVASLQRQCAACGVTTIAEFVERADTVEKLKKFGIAYAQGFGIASPMPLT